MASGQTNALIADQAIGSVDGIRIPTCVSSIALGSNDEEGSGLIQGEEASEIQIAAVHDVERPWLWDEEIKDVDVVQLAV